MGKGSNTFKKAIRHLKSTQIDEKLQLLSEIPTNNTSGIYVVEPEYQVQDPDVPGAEPADFTQDALPNGRDTTGLFSEDGTILTIEPPDELGNKSFILGPMASMWYAWGNFSTIGYIRQSDRRMVDLGRIAGRLGSWNGTNNFTSYGQLTIEQARWFRDTPKLNGANNDTPNYRAFYPGPPSNAPDQYGRYLCVITGTPKPTSYTPPPRRIPPGMGGFDPNLPPGSANPYLTDKPVPPDILGDLAILGLSAAAVTSLGAALASGAATALLSRLRYLAKLRMDRGALNPFGQTAVRSGAAGRQRVDVYTGRPYQGPRGNRTGTQYGTVNRQTANTYTNPGPLRGTPGTGAQTNPAGSLDKGTLPQRYIDKYGSRSVLGQQQVKMSPSAARRTFGESLNESSDLKGDYANAFVLKLFSDHSDPYDKIDEIIKIIEKHLKTKSNKIKESFDNSNTKKIIREIKKPYVLPEQPKVKYKIKPRASRTINVDLMKKAEVPSSFKKVEDRMWGKYEWKQNARASQERKNEVLDHLGGSDHAWEWLTETSRKKNNKIMYGNFGDGEKEYEVVRKEELKGDTLLFIVDENGRKESILQSELSCRIADEFNKELFEKYFKEQETAQVDKDPLFKKVSKRLKKEIDYPDKPAKRGYPNDPPPEMINGWHPKFGDRADYYNKLDPQSADFMPSTENPEIDIKVEKSKSKKFKVKEETKINWKKDISKHKKHYMEGKVVQEGMTSSETFFVTLPATGDTDLTSLSGGDSSIYDSLGQGDSYGSYGQLPSTRISNSGTGSGINGGFNVGSNYLAFNGKDSNTVRVATLNPVDTSTVDSISITGLRGNNSNGGVTPASDLVLIYYNIDTEEFGEITVMSSSGPTSLTKQSFSLPKEAQGKNVQFYFYDITSDGHGYDGKQFIGKTLSVSGISNYPLTSSYSNILDFYINVPYNQIINRDPQSIQPSWYSMGRFFWDNILRSTIGWGTNVDIQGPPGPISGGTKYWSTSTEPPAGLGYMTVADYIYIGQQIYLQFSGAATYGISNISFQRRAPMNVFVPLNSPEATAFIRTEPNLSNLSPQEKQQKLKEMLEASDEYLEKILGPEFPGTGAVPPGESSETPGVEITSDQDTQIAQNWPSIKDAKPSQTTPIAPVWAPGEPLHPGQRPYTGPTPSGPPVRLAHYEPKGQLISERRKLKSPEEVLNKIPGYYDGKPAPLGFPVEKPPEMVNGMHSDLVDGKKVANRFNRLDPESAKAMPPTGNPHIDKKVKAAQKKPK